VAFLPDEFLDKRFSELPGTVESGPDENGEYQKGLQELIDDYTVEVRT